MFLFQAIHLAKELAHKEQKLYRLKTMHGEADETVIRLSSEVQQLNQAYQAILSEFPALPTSVSHRAED